MSAIYRGSRVSDRGKVKAANISLSIETRDDGNPFYNTVSFVDHGETSRAGGLTLEFMFFSVQNPDAILMAKEILTNLAPELLAK